MFALQVSTHDTMWGGPKEAPSLLKRAIKIAILLPAVALFLIPSFKLGRATFRTPTFTLPDSVKQGNVFTIPADEEITSIQLEGRSLPELKLKQPMFLVAASSVPQLDLVLNYRAPERHLTLKMFLPHFENPSFDIFNKQIKIEPPEAQTSPVISGEQTAPHMAPVVPAFDSKTFNRTDGLVAASCWKEPALEELPLQLARNGRHPPTRQASLTAAGQGEVLQVSAPFQGEKTLLVYHGGGLYSRYYGVRETKVRKGDRVTAGMPIATTEAGNWRKPATARWDLYLNQTELNRANFLALSSQLCDSK